MKKTILLVAPFLLGVLLFATACNKNNSPATDSAAAKPAAKNETEDAAEAAPESDAAKFANVGYVACRVFDETSQGCGFMLGLRNGKKMWVENMPDRYKSHGMVCYVKYTASDVRPDGCTAGKSVRIIDIQYKNPSGEGGRR